MVTSARLHRPRPAGMMVVGGKDNLRNRAALSNGMDVTEAAEGSDASEISSKLRNVAWGSEPDDDTSSSLMQKASASRDAFSANVVFMVACKILLGGGKRGNNIFLHAVVP